MNSVQIMGRIASDLELKRTQSQKAVLSFRVAVDAGYATQDGQRQAYFFDVVAWEGTAQLIATWFEKGQMIAIQGRLQTRSWTDKHEQKRVSVEIAAQNVFFCGDRKKESAGAGTQGNVTQFAASAGAPAFAENYGSYQNDFRPLEGDDDVPF